MIEYNEDSHTKIVLVGETLLGTCKSLDDVLQEVFGDDQLTSTDLDIVLCHELDDITMSCDNCGWWCETGFLDDEQVCDDCRDETDR